MDSTHSPPTTAPRRWRITVSTVLLSLFTVVLSACGSTASPGGNPTPTPRTTPTPSPVSVCTTWSVVPSPNPTTYQQSALNAISVSSPANVWVAGSNFADSGPIAHLTERWNGTSWSVVPGQGEFNLMGVAAISPTDVWVVGTQHAGLPEPYQTHTLIEHWNGTAWSVVPSPNPGVQSSALNSVVALASNDVWAVGNMLGNGARRPLIEHWNGTAWTVVAGPDLPGVTDSSLRAIARVPGSNHLWAVGYMLKGPSPALDQALIEYWNGQSWTVVTPAAPAGAKITMLNGVVALTSGDAWAVGSYVLAGSEKERGLIEHWNGTTWQPVSTPQTATIAPSQFVGVAAASAHDVRVVGRYFVGDESMGRGLVARWDGASWSVVATPTPSGVTHNMLNAIVSDGAGHFWAVGWGADSMTMSLQTLILHCP